MLGEYTNKKMAATSPCQLQNNTMIETRCYPSSVLCICLWLLHRKGVWIGTRSPHKVHAHAQEIVTQKSRSIFKTSALLNRSTFLDVTNTTDLMIWESPLSNKHGPLFADTCEDLMEGHHGGPPWKLFNFTALQSF